MATAALVNTQLGLCTDKYGNVYFQDSSLSVRKITVNTGIITRVAGTGNNVYIPYSGDGILATSCHIGPFGISTDKFDNLYICDYGNSIVVRVDVNGFIQRIVGTPGSYGYSGDGGPALLAKIWAEGVTSDPCGNIYIADFGNRVVRRVMFNPFCVDLSIDEARREDDYSIYPNPAQNELVIENATGCEMRMFDIVGREVYRSTIGSKLQTIDISQLETGVYVVQLNSDRGVKTLRVVKR